MEFVCRFAQKDILILPSCQGINQMVQVVAIFTFSELFGGQADV